MRFEGRASAAEARVDVVGFFPEVETSGSLRYDIPQGLKPVIFYWLHRPD